MEPIWQAKTETASRVRGHIEQVLDWAAAHGFRSTFRDWAAERTQFPREVAEMALAHAIGDKVEAAYRRGDLFEKRRRLMDDWAAFLDRPAAAGNLSAT
ncbi:hypothetical protein HHL10_20920 [Azohydromonas sp. G-1-1-14]|uniref:Phage integrase central domain-containing protein n=1 Tax=Azohydromonas caseinilytica TaxID=2728836 RepID=A0A848FB61_9BURK|nr:hypothetical protein [Azohydromonas caseinilytica]